MLRLHAKQGDRPKQVGLRGQKTSCGLDDAIDFIGRRTFKNAGTNDIAGNTGPSTLEMIEDNLKSMVQIAAANGIKVILASVTPAYDYPWKRGL